MGKLIDLREQTFGKWSVLSRVDSRSGRAYWLCECVCGTRREVWGAALRNGASSSCGPCGRITHGATTAPEYQCWYRMIKRCTDSSQHNYLNYGGRGIKVHPGWVGAEGFAVFLQSIGSRPSLHYTLDRVDNDGDYEPGNVRWATPKQQHRNKRSNKLVTYAGKTRCLAEWAEYVNIDRKVIGYRLRSGWSVVRALTTPNRRKR